MALLLAFAVLFLFGFAVLRSLNLSKELLYTLGLPLPLSLTLALGLCKLLHNLVSLERAWQMTVVVMLVTTVGLTWRLAQSGRLRFPQKPDLTKTELIGLACAFAVSYFYLHSQQVLYPENDYLTHFPLIGLLARGNFPPPNPYYPEVSLHGHFGRDYLIALLSRSTGGDHVFTIWCFNHLLSLSAFLLAAGLGYRSGYRMGALFVPVLVFFGISVGSRVGLVDTFDNNNLLVYTLLLAFLALLCEQNEGEKVELKADLFLVALLGVYAIVYETHMILFLGLVISRPFVRAWCARTAVNTKTLLSACAVCLLSLLLGAIMGGVLQDLALRAVRAGDPVAIDRFASYESQQVHITFPKKNLFEVYLGSEQYNRVSCVYEAKVFGKFVPPLDQGGYTSIFSTKFLVLHWLALYLGLPAGVYLVVRRNFVGMMFWSFGLFSFLTPAVVDFGPIHELEYLRWEFGAGFGFAGSLGIVLAELWQGRRFYGCLKPLLILVLLVTSYGGIRRINQAVISLQKASPQLRKELLNPFYTSGFDWLARRPELEIDSMDLAATRWLRDQITTDDRLLLPDEPRNNIELLPEATVLGLTGTRAVGHQSPPPWLPVGTYPYFHNPNWTVFWQEFDARALGGLKADWIYLKQADRFPRLAELGQLKKAYEEGGRAIFQVLPQDHGQPFPEEFAITQVELAERAELQSEVAFPLGLRVRNEGGAEVDWKGVLGLQLISTDDLDSHPPLLWLNCQLRLSPGQDTALKFWLVPPLVEGDYRLRFVTPQGEGEREVSAPPTYLSYSFKANAAALQLADVVQQRGEGERVEVELTLRSSAPGFRVQGPLFIGWRVWDGREKRYGTPFGFDGLAPLELSLAEPSTKTMKVQANLPPDDERYQLHFFLVSRSRLEVPLGL